jgi:hypothetical protein
MHYFSIQEGVLESLRVPYSLLVENEELSRFHVAEHHVLVEEVARPDELVLDSFSRNFFQVLDVDDVLGDAAAQESLVENDLLGVRQELSVPREVSLLRPSSGDEAEGDQRWQQKNVGAREKQPCAPKAGAGHVAIAPFESVVRLLTLVEEYTVLMGRNSIEVAMGIDHWGGHGGVCEQKSDGLENQTVLESALGAEIVVC